MAEDGTKAIILITDFLDLNSQFSKIYCKHWLTSFFFYCIALLKSG